MAACEVNRDIPTPPALANSRVEEDELELQVSMNESELFEKSIDGLSVNDVYNIAASVGKEFEKLTDAFGGAIFSEIMPKIIRVLEMLESFAGRSQNYSTDVVELQATVQKLQIDGKSNTEKHREELDMVDSAWREETRQLLQTIESLQEDNKKLTQMLSEKLDDTGDVTNGGEQQAAVVGILGESMEKQRDELREKNRLIDQQTAECEALSAQTQQLTKLNVNLRRKVAVMEKHATSMASQTTDLQSTCAEKDRQIKDLQKRVSDLTSQLKGVTDKSSHQGEHHSMSQVVHDAPIDPLLANKLVVDLDDPDRPRYTMHELQEVLTEKNTFKLKCILLEDELEYYKQKEDSWEEIDNSEFLGSAELEVNNNNSSSRQTVNGDKPESAIKKLFDSIFSRHAKSPAIPHEPQGQRPRVSSQLRYDPLFIDVSDVMPAIDITPSPDEETNPLAALEMKSTMDTEGAEKAPEETESDTTSEYAIF